MGAARGRAPVDAPRIPGMEPLRPLGRGGFADVILCRWDGGHGRDALVAVKALRPEAPARQALAFRREIEILAALSGRPGLPAVLGSGVAADGRDWLALAHCPPPSVVDLLAGGPLPVGRALEIGMRVAGAAGAIHGAGFAHRDIKPANILLDASGAAVLIDPGIAAPLGAPGGGAEVGGSSPLWAPPEQQLSEGPLGAAVDVYALGATLYTLLAGRSPHEAPGGPPTGGDQLTVLNRVIHDPRPPIGRDDVPESLEAVLSRALSLDPAERHPSMSALAGDLRPLTAETGRKRHRDRSKW